MLKFTSSLLAMLAITSLVAADSGRTKGYRQVQTGAISHCGVNTGQQCFKVETGLDRFALLTDEPLDIACDPSGLCVLPFDFDQRGKTSFFIGQCLNTNGEITGSAVNVTLGLRSISAHSSAYASFVLKGNVKAKWEYDEIYTTSVSRITDIQSLGLITDPEYPPTERHACVLFQEGRKSLHRLLVIFYRRFLNSCIFHSMTYFP